MRTLRCAQCGAEQPHAVITRDHIVPRVLLRNSLEPREYARVVSSPLNHQWLCDEHNNIKGCRYSVDYRGDPVKYNGLIALLKRHGLDHVPVYRGPGIVSW